jgi:hypothetical protein
MPITAMRQQADGGADLAVYQKNDHLADTLRSTVMGTGTRRCRQPVSPMILELRLLQTPIA